MRKHILLGHGKCCHKKQIHLSHGGSSARKGEDDFSKSPIHHGGVFRDMDGHILGDGKKKRGVHFGKGAVKKIQPLKFMR